MDGGARRSRQQAPGHDPAVGAHPTVDARSGLVRFAEAARTITTATTLEGVLFATAGAARSLVTSERAVASHRDGSRKEAVDSTLAAVDARSPDDVPRLEVGIVGSDGQRLGALEASDPVDGSFDDDDEAALASLAQLAAATIERLDLTTRLTSANPGPGRRADEDVDTQHAVDAGAPRRQRVVETLHRVGQAITSRLDLDAIVQLVTDEATELTPAAFGAFFYNRLDANGGSLLLFTVSGAPREQFEHFPNPRATRIFAPTFEGQATLLIDDLLDDPRFGQNPPYAGLPPGHLPVRSYLATPVILTSGEVAGSLLFGHPEPGRFSEDDAWLVEGIASYAAIAIDNARLYDRSLRIATVLQESLLPPTLPAIDGVELAARYEAGSTSVGGDFYDVFPLPDGEWALLIGDMCGKGPEAASRTSLARHTVRTAGVLEPDCHHVLQMLNQTLLDRSEPDRFCTAVYGKLCQRGRGIQVDLVAAGHPPPMVRRADGTTELVDIAGTVLGVVDDVVLDDATVALAPGDLLVLYTDGVVEARSVTGELLGEERLASVVAAAGADAHRVADAIEEAVLAFRAGRHADDLAVLVIAAS